MTVHASPDYAIHPQGDPPPDYPTTPHPDSFQPAPNESTYDQRRSDYIAHVLKNPAPQNTKPVWYELVRMAGGGRPHEGIIFSSLDFIDARKDCSDFVLHGILRLLYQETREQRPETSQPIPNPLASESLLSHAKQTVLNFKYFPNESGIDSLCTWTENHYILFTSAAYLAGQLYPDEVFANSGESGKQKVELNRKRILLWLDLRFRTGFSEWLSHVYYDEDLTALLSLYDFAQDDEIRRKAKMVIDLLLLDMALNSFKGVFGSTHGRAYENTKKWASNEGTTDTMKLLFGMGIYSAFDNMSAPAFALSGYRVPKVIENIATQPPSGSPHFLRKWGERQRGVENRQRIGIKLAEMEKWGLHPDNFEDGMLYLTLEAYLHPRTIANTLEMFNTCNWWENSFLDDFKPYRGLLSTLNAVGGLPLLARLLEWDVCRNTREEVNIYTYKTPDYMLSTAQDYRKGYGGDQQHIWQATLRPDAVCFTTHPAKIEGVTPNYWAGSGLLPRAAQYKNLTIAIYNIKKIPALYVPIRHFFTHAWLPKDKFDEVIERDGWIFACKDNGYLALHSQNPYFWNTKDLNHKYFAFRRNEEDFDREIVVPGKQNIWLCQLGRKDDDGSFEGFIDAISSAELTFSGLNVEYRSPGNGVVRFGWKGAFTVDNVEIQLHDYPRYDNPYVQAEFDPSEIKVTAGDHELYLNWKTGERTTI
ncbi:MAG: hypothetical protein PVJ21_18305 [Anaerolineales bacterium]|jgi:hypothetical protein